jgi:hypothetical protein
MFALAGVLLLAACSSGGDSESAESVVPSTTTTAATTTVAPTTTVDPLDSAMTAAGYPELTSAERGALEDYCDFFSNRDVEAINAGAKNSELLTTAFEVLCPENVGLVGQLFMPNGDPVFPGYPLIVDISTVDRRIRSSFEDKVVDGQLVALAPGVYTAFNPNVPDLAGYLTGPSSGDCIMRNTYFPSTGGSCWDGVQKGTAEP